MPISLLFRVTCVRHFTNDPHEQVAKLVAPDYRLLIPNSLQEIGLNTLHKKVCITSTKVLTN